jgi:predicted transcriptional regulator of viral defense system
MSQLEQIPYFNLATAGLVLKKQGLNLYRKIERMVKSGQLIILKRGLYTTRLFYLTVKDKNEFISIISTAICPNSYLSLEYALSFYGLIPEQINSYTAITLKSTRNFKNSIGSFIYKNIKTSLFAGYKDGLASKAKALFDYIYLKNNLSGLDDLRINFENLSLDDLKEFNQYCKLSKSVKMDKIAKLIERKYVN